MERTIKILSAVLAAQLAVAVVLFASSGAFQGTGESPHFVDIDGSMIDEIVVSAPDAEPVILRKEEDAWTLPDYKNLPVDETKRAEVIERLVDSRAAWPVATSASAAERFEVTEDKHQRHVVLRADGNVLADLYLGTSPGFRQVHARRAGDDDVFAIDFNNYELPTKADDWIDKELLEPSGEITAIETRQFTLKKTDDGWQLDGLPEDAHTDTTEADSLARALKTLRVTGAADDEAVAGVEGKVPTFSYGVETDSGAYSYAFYESDDEYLVKAANRDVYFRVSKYTGDRLKIDRDKLVADTKEIAGHEPAENTSS
jgi:hypothetical protein